MINGQLICFFLFRLLFCYLSQISSKTFLVESILTGHSKSIRLWPFLEPPWVCRLRKAGPKIEAEGNGVSFVWLTKNVWLHYGVRFICDISWYYYYVIMCIAGGHVIFFYPFTLYNYHRFALFTFLMGWMNHGHIHDTKLGGDTWPLCGWCVTDM